MKFRKMSVPFAPKPGISGIFGRMESAPGEKSLRAKTRTNNKLNPHMMSSPGIVPGPHWWEASALTTAPSLLPTNISDLNETLQVC